MNNNNFLKKRLLLAVISSSLVSTSLAYAAFPHQPEPEPDPTPPPSNSLKGVQPPAVPGLERYVKDKKAAIKLGKIFFWDVQAGSQGQSCGSCHFSAGADNRVKNQISPSILHENEAMAEAFNMANFPHTGSGKDGGPNYTLTIDDFPLHRLADNKDRESEILYESDDVISSQGVSGAEFIGLGFFGHDEKCKNVEDIFHVNGKNTRRVEPRNTPTVINAVFNFRNLWDGRANNVFNGVDPFGRRNKDAKVLRFDLKRGKLKSETVHLINSSLASQAVGPAVDDFEMACGGKTFPLIGRKLLNSQPLGKQLVDPKDSQLGKLSAYPHKGLRTDYRRLIMDAFNQEYWMSPTGKNGFSQIESNFSLFWGLAIQLYQSTLISDDTRFDRFLDGDQQALSIPERRGLGVFFGQGLCVRCHGGLAFTAAAQELIPPNFRNELVDRMIMSDNQSALYDTGFYNIGVRPTEEDLGLGRSDPYGYPLSYTRQVQEGLGGAHIPDDFDIDIDKLGINPGTPIGQHEKNAIDGAFKVPGLRNIELTGPYMHNGGMATLRQVIEFYNRGGNARTLPDGTNTTAYEGDHSNLDRDIMPLGLSEQQIDDLVAFLKALTDERVRWEKAPFDRPQIFVPNGHIGDEYGVSVDKDGKAQTEWLEIPAVGADGREAKNLPAIQPFLSQTTTEPVPTGPKAIDDHLSGSFFGALTINVLDNDASDIPLDITSVEIVKKPSQMDGKVVNHGDGSISYHANINKDVTISYRVKDTAGNVSNVGVIHVDTRW
ncbi:cytochrome-c peroxidase [Photobacterium jeanii]|uniref:Cytochrome-c peroxidase n=1 Tax=Photobacterium jeanii TaxID=858640 RepID=A0A178KKC8_9GAMM|nr:cytochrome c peroxidase [Photobacterium jeanii]OAN17670.1 cytochrome-c peroxidase [Photobacterium jeanii]PST92673.1 cytochrome-c peroxidase [Photobacterium jeanii]